MKKPFLYELRGKAKWRKNRVLLIASALMAVYEGIGRADWSLAVAQTVGLFWKYVVFSILFGSICYVLWRISRRVLNPELPSLQPAWGYFLVSSAFVFALVTADRRLLFHLGTILCILFSAASHHYLVRKVTRARHGPRLLPPKGSIQR